MYIDSHCHLNFPDLRANVNTILADMDKANVGHALVVSVNMRDWPSLIELVEEHDNLRASVGVHPDNDPEDDDHAEPSLDYLLDRSQHPKVVAIGETGLDYYRLQEPLGWQRDRFKLHIQAANESGLPLIIHTRSAAADTIRLMQENRAHKGVMHCFTETWEVAQAALDLGFYISFSGIVTFKNAQQIQDVAKKVPLDKMLIETDSPFLAPVPFRGKRNDPSKVVHTAAKIAELRGLAVADIEQATAENYFKLFDKAAV